MVGSRSQAPNWVFAAQGTETEALQSSKQIYTYKDKQIFC
jgi:hypothetical protein